MSRLPPICVIPAEVIGSSHESSSSRMVRPRYACTSPSLAHVVCPDSVFLSVPLYGVEAVYSMDGYIHEPDLLPSSPVCSYKHQVTIDPTLCHSPYGRLSPSSLVCLCERQVPIDST